MNSKKPEIWACFVRGFFDGDGCLYFSKRKGTYSEFKRTHHTYPRIFIGSRSIRVVKDLHKLIERLGIHSTVCRIKAVNEKERDGLRIIVRGSEMLEKWMSTIGTNNDSKKTKYLLWKKQGFCPSHTTLQQRLKMLD